jgi:1A family penicillin-binding protein
MKRVQWYDVWQAKQMKLSGHRSSRNRDKGKLMVRIAMGAFALLVAGIVALVIMFAYFAKDLPSPDKVVRHEGFSTKIYDRTGKLLYDVFSNEKRTPVKLEDLRPDLKEAVVAIEDKSFYTHKGVDPLTPFRIVYNLIFKHRLIGGSSLTQQLVKNALLSNERTITRKVKEFILSLQVESRYSKDEILLMYLNESPYGGTAWGVGEAAQMYFGKQVKDLNLVESAILAGLPQWPSRFSPFSGKAYEDRTKEVLRRMREDGYISADEEKKALEDLPNVAIATQSGTLEAPHFVFYVKQLLEDKYGEEAVEQGGLRVTTTLDLDLQKQAQEMVAAEVEKVKHLNINNGAAVVMDVKTGQILTMVGSKNWSDPNYDGKYNVTTALRQPGSSIKPVVYLTALRKGYTASTLLMDTPVTFPGGDAKDYSPVNYDGKFHGPALVRDALGNSLNIPAVKMLAMVGIKDMLTVAYDMGFTSLEPTADLLKRVGLSMALGGGEVKLLDETAAYSAFANGGLRVDPIAILKVTDIDGKVLEEWKPTEERRAMSPGEAFIISSILSDPEARKMTFGTGSRLEIPGKTVAVKTGTTNDKKDNWTVGWTPSVIVGVWVGNNDNTPMKQVASGVTGASPIWAGIIKTALKNKTDEKFVMPDEVMQLDVDKVSGFRAHDGFESKKEYFIKGTEPWADDSIHKKVKVCKGEGKLATPADIGSGNYDEKEFFYFKEEDPYESQTGKNRWQEGILAWLNEQQDPKYHPPTDYCSNNNPIWVRITEPGDKARVNNRDVKLRVEVDDLSPVRKIEVSVDGSLKYTNNSAPYEVTIPNLLNGYHKVDVRAEDEAGKVGTRYVEFAVNQDYSGPPQPTATPTPIPSPTPTMIPGP